MANNILITPGQAKIAFSGASSENIELAVASNGDIQFNGTTDGLLLSISEINDLIDLVKKTRIQDQLYLGTGSISATGKLLITGTGTSAGLTFYNDTGNQKRIWNDDSDDSFNITIGGSKNNGFRLATDGEGYLGGNRILTTADTGSGNGLDADLLDGYTSSAFARKSENAGISGSWQFTGKVTLSNVATRLSGLDGSNQHTIQYSTDASDQILRFTRNGLNDYSLELFEGGSAATVWTSANDGTGSGMDADLLDGYEASAFPRKDEDAVVSGNWNFTGQTTFVDTTTISTGDNIILLNNDVTGTPTENAGIEVERGTSANALWLWSETSDYWTPGGHRIGNIGDPTSDDHVGDRGYNDARYALSGSAPTFTGDVTAPRLRLTATDDAGVGSTAHAFQIGATNSVNLIIDGNEIMARNNGANNGLALNADGGVVTVNGSRVLTVADEGSGNGLDADTLDGQHGSYYQTASGYTAADVLTKLLTVDGSGSGLDADLLDGLHASSMVRTDLSSTIASDLALQIGSGEGAVLFYHNAAASKFFMAPYDGGSFDYDKEFIFDADNGYWEFEDRLDIGGALNVSGNVTLQGSLSSPTDPTLGSHVGDRDYNDGRYGKLASSNVWSGNQAFTAGGQVLSLKSGSTDHVYMGFFARDAQPLTRSAYIGFGGSGTTTLAISNEISGGHTVFYTIGGGEVRIGSDRILTVADEGAGNGLDADTVDSLEASQFLRVDTDDTILTDVEVTIGTLEGSIVLEHINAENRFRIAPYDGGSFDTSKELTFDADIGYWQFKDQLDVGGSLTVGTTAHIDDEVTTEKVSIDDTSDNKKFEIVYNSVSDSLDFNFVG